MKNNQCPVIAIVGRANVGKSTLFNCLSNTRNALVANLPGLTRDRQYANCQYHQQPYIIIDTAGLESDQTLPNEKKLYKAIESQIKIAIDEADYIFFIVDAKTGITSQDQFIANKLRITAKKVFLIANKSENNLNLATNQFYELGFSDLYAISSSHRQGINKLLAQVLSLYQYPSSTIESEPNRIKFAVIGRPNVGKSTLVNSLIKHERMLASDLAGTTRDSIDVDFIYNNLHFTIVDTAGIRKRSKVHDTIEKFSILKVLKNIATCELIVIMIDATAGVNHQDITVLNHAIKAKKPIIIAINKTDLLTNDNKKNVQFMLKEKLHFVTYTQFVFISAQQKQGLTSLMASIIKIYNNINIKLSTPKLTRILQEAVKRQPLPNINGKKPKLKYAHQGGTNPLIIVIHGTRTSQIPKSYVKYLTKVFREICQLNINVFLEFKDNINPFAPKIS